MVRATLRGLIFSLDNRNREEVISYYSEAMEANR